MENIHLGGVFINAVDGGRQIMDGLFVCTLINNYVSEE